MKQNSNSKQTNVSKATLHVLSSLATVFAHSACTGRAYEAKVPAKLRK